MRNNIVTAIIKGDTHIHTQHVYQYDYGLKLVFQGFTPPEFYDVHFMNAGDTSATVVHGGPEGVLIPDSLLLTGKDIYAWMFAHADNDDGETVYEIRIPVVQRAKASHEPVTPVEQNEIDQVMAQLRRGVEITEENVAKTVTNVIHYPYINDENHHWMVWDAATEAFVDTGVEAIGERGKLENMRIGVVQTLPPGAQATASVEVGDDEIILNLGIPSGDALNGFALFEEQANQDVVTFPYGARNVAISDIIVKIVPEMEGSGEPGPQNVRRMSPRDGLTLTHNSTEHVFTFGVHGGVYGGTLNPLTGKLMIDRVMITKRCVDMDYNEYAAGWRNAGIRSIVGEDVDQVFTGQFLNVGTSYGINTTDGNDVLYLPYADYGMTQTQWIATEINVQICVMLAEPVEVDLVPIMMPTVFGANSISADAGPVKYIRYPCDTKLYIDQKVAALQALILEHE